MEIATSPTEQEPTTPPQLTVIEGGPSSAPEKRADMKPEELTTARNILVERDYEAEAENEDFVYHFARAYFFHSVPAPDNQDQFKGAVLYAQKILHPGPN